MRTVRKWISYIVCVGGTACSAGQMAPPTRPVHPGTAATSNMSTAVFAQLLKGIDWDVEDADTAQAEIQRALTNTGWSLRSLSLNRYQTNAGMAPSGSGRVTTASDCIRVPDVVASLGPPPSMTLAPPLGSLDISTPGLVSKYLQAGKVMSVQYALKPALSYWFDFDAETGCFDTFHIQRR